jgi:hypothetical protein
MQNLSGTEPMDVHRLRSGLEATIVVSALAAIASAAIFMLPQGQMSTYALIALGLNALLLGLASVALIRMKGTAILPPDGTVAE